MIENATSETASVSAERRQDSRRRTLMSATLRYHDHSSTLSCMVRNMSSHGARLELPAAGWVPEHFELDIPAQNIRVPVRLAWRQPEAVGVSFAIEDGMTLKDISAIAALKQENDRLKARIRTLTDET